MVFLEVSMSKKTYVLAAVALSAVLFSAAPRAVMLCKDGFLPQNDLKIPIGSLEDKGITQLQFNAVMDRAEAIYAPIIKARGGRLVLKRLWDDPTVNASAQRSGKDYVLNMYGGLARHATITQDGMALVVCHELGHHIGGAPKYGGFNNWASNEGQADYFANMKCLHRIFGAPGAESFTQPTGDETLAREACDKAYPTEGERGLCVRSSMAGMSVTELFRALRKEDPIPHFNTPDPKVVKQMFDSHPGTQCRLDTYFAGALCTQPFLNDVSETDPAVATCTRSNGFSVGLRPRCWYLNPATEPAGLEALTAMPVKPMNASPTLAVLKSESVFSGL